MPPAGRGFSHICPDGHIYALASAKHSNKFDILLSTFAIFELKFIYMLGLGIIKVNFASALDFCYICPSQKS